MHDGNAPSYLDPDDWDEFERLLTATARELTGFLRGPAERRRWKPTPPESLRRIQTPFTDAGQPLDTVIAGVMRDVLPYGTGNTEGRWWSWVSGGGTAPGVIADLIASTMNSSNLGFDATASTEVELHLLGELKRALGFAAQYSGTLTTGTSTGTLIGLAAAREAGAGFSVRTEGLMAPGVRPLCLYCSSEAHNSVRKAANLLGFGERGTHVIPVRDDFTLDLARLREAIVIDLAEGWRPVAVVATLGSVNTGAVDDLSGLRRLCDEFGLWLHADAAFGAALLLLPDLPPEVAAVRTADSMTFDLHKWFYQQADIGAVFIRDAEAHRAAFQVGADYLAPLPAGLASGPTNFSHYGVQLSRCFRALRAWMSIKHLGWDRFRRAIRRNLDQARYLTDLIEAEPDLEICAPTRLNVVNFRFVGEDARLPEERLNDVNRRVLMGLQTDGIAVPSSTVLRGAFTIRAAIVNHRTTYADLEATVAGTVRLGRAVVAEGGAT